MKNLALLLIFLVSACASLPKKEEMEKQVQNYTLPGKPNKGEGVVYVVRPDALGSLVRFNVFHLNGENESEMGWNRGIQHIYFYLPPGKHKILSVAENTEEMEFEVKEGEPVFIKQNSEFGFIMARNSLQKISQLEGKYHIKKTKLGKILRER